jgi:hypothetical protein
MIDHGFRCALYLTCPSSQTWLKLTRPNFKSSRSRFDLFDLNLEVGNIHLPRNELG